MTGLKLEGFVEGLSPRQCEFITSVLEKLGYDEGEAVVERVGKPGDNFAADVRRITAEKDGNTLKTVVKIASTVPQIRDAVRLDCLFRNEHLMYTEVLPKLTELEEAAGVPESERLMYAKCYGSLSGEPCEVILLEDLQVSGYTMQDKFTSLSDHEVKLVLKSIAALHASSYALKYQEPETFKTFENKLYKMWESFAEMDQVLQQFEKMEQEMCQIITEEKYQNELKGRVGKLADRLSNTFKREDDSKYYVIQQGDCWTNNLLFLKEDDKMVSCCMIDYQVSCANIPAVDLGYMIFNCTDHDTRMKHFNDWLEYYYTELDKYLSYYDLTAETVYPKDRFYADVKRNGESSLAQGVFVSSVILREGDDAQKLKQAMSEQAEGDTMENMAEAMSMNTMNEGSIVKFKARVEQLIDSHLELKLL